MRIILLGILCFILSGAEAQSELLTTQFAYNKLRLNPAYAGVEDQLAASIIIRDQWNGLEGAPKMQSISFDFPVLSQNIALGFNLSNETIGIQKRLKAEASYAYLIRSEDKIIHLGMKTSYTNWSNDFTDDRLIAIDGFDLDPNLAQMTQSFHLFNIGLGAYMRWSQYYLGLSADRLLKNNISDLSSSETEDPQFYFMAGKEHSFGPSLKLFPEFLIRYTPSLPVGFDFQLRSLILDSYLFGINYRTGGGSGPGESIGIMLGLHTSLGVLVGLAYDVNVSDYKQSNKGSLELFARYRFGKKNTIDEIVNPRYF